MRQPIKSAIIVGKYEEFSFFSTLLHSSVFWFLHHQIQEAVVNVVVFVVVVAVVVVAVVVVSVVGVVVVVVVGDVATLGRSAARRPGG